MAVLADYLTFDGQRASEAARLDEEVNRIAEQEKCDTPADQFCPVCRRPRMKENA